MQQLSVKDFGPIKDLELDVGSFHLFVGPQAGGKSTIAKLIYYFQSLRDVFARHAIDAVMKRKIPDDPLQEVLHAAFKYFDSLWTPGILNKAKFSFIYESQIDNSKLRLNFEAFQNGGINYHLYGPTNQKLKAIYKELQDNLPKNGSGSATQNIALAATAGQQIEEFFGIKEQFLFIPAGRSLLSLTTSATSSDALLRQFLDDVSKLRSTFSNGISSIDTSRTDTSTEAIELSKSIIAKILKGTYKHEENEDRLYYDETRFVPLGSASSGQQEALWILLLLHKILIDDNDYVLFIEEPEAHLFPEAQRDIAALIALVANQRKNKVILTTHSPYILSSFNNHLFAHTQGQHDPEKTGIIIPKETWLDPNKVQTHFVEKGTIRGIMDHDEGMVNSFEIDNASNLINNDFENLFNIGDTDA